MRTHQKTPCKFCWKQIQVNSLTAHMATCNQGVEDVSFQCDQCPFRSKRKDSRDSHIKSMHENKKEKTNETNAEAPKHSCKICKREFNTTKQLRDHTTEHSQKHECGICGKQFARKFVLTQHLNTIHLKKKIESKSGFGIFEEEEVKRPALKLECEQCGYKSKKSGI